MTRSKAWEGYKKQKTKCSAKGCHNKVWFTRHGESKRPLCPDCDCKKHKGG